MKKFLLKLLLVIFFLFVFIYVMSINSIPKNLLIFEGEKINFKTVFGMEIKRVDIVKTSSTSSDLVNKNANTRKKERYEVSLFNNLLLKEINVDVLPRQTIIPVGSMAGLKLYTSGVLVVGMSEIEGADKIKVKPYENTGIKEGDTIIKINNVSVTSTADLIEKVNQSNGDKINIMYVQDRKIKQCTIYPVEVEKSKYKLGIWVRDSAAGVGTVTFYDPVTKGFAALGHGISDVDTNKLLNISSGEFVTTKVLDIIKGEEGKPGKIQGTIDEQKIIGEIYKNSEFGIFGKVNQISNLPIDKSKEMEIALRDEIQIGKAVILCDLENESIKEYEIEIEKKYMENNNDNKSMKIKIVDKELLELTGGIIQGMSGAPIIQNNKVIGAVTNVLVNNPKEGYGIFADIMLKQMRSTE